MLDVWTRNDHTCLYVADLTFQDVNVLKFGITGSDSPRRRVQQHMSAKVNPYRTQAWRADLLGAFWFVSRRAAADVELALKVFLSITSSPEESGDDAALSIAVGRQRQPSGEWLRRRGPLTVAMQRFYTLAAQAVDGYGLEYVRPHFIDAADGWRRGGSGLYEREVHA